MNLKTIFRMKPLTLLIVLHVIILLFTIYFLLHGKQGTPLERNKIIVLPIEGVISMEPGSLRHGLSVDTIVKTLEKYREDKNVKAAILRINSPGGTVAAVQEIYRALQKFKKEGKVIVSSFEEVSASGGYYIACAGDHIVVNPGTLTGSIGVIMQIPNVRGLLQKVGVSMETIRSGQFKDAGSPFRKMTSMERRLLTELITNAYDQFYAAVKEGRKLDDKALKYLADGRIFTGEMAVNKKLADELGGLEEAEEAAKKLAGIEGTEPHIIFHKGKTSLSQLLNLITKSPLEPIKNASEAGVRLLYMMP
jgi:protease-4